MIIVTQSPILYIYKESLLNTLMLNIKNQNMKLTPTEQEKLKAAENGEYINAKDINWDN